MDEKICPSQSSQESLETTVSKLDVKYERYAKVLDVAAVAGFSIAATQETSPLKYLLGFGALCSGLKILFKVHDSYENHPIQKAQIALGSAAALLSGGYYYLGDSRFSGVLAGVGAACLANVLSNHYRAQKTECKKAIRGDY